MGQWHGSPTFTANLGQTPRALGSDQAIQS